jgi:hypothetical protein
MTFYVVVGLAGLALFVMIFLALRELVLWYWKIDASLKVLEEIRDVLTEINQQQRATAAAFPCVFSTPRAGRNDAIERAP